jgi:hypothetical protein
MRSQTPSPSVAQQRPQPTRLKPVGLNETTQSGRPPYCSADNDRYAWKGESSKSNANRLTRHKGQECLQI